MLTGSCHCGAVRVEVPTPPTAATMCNCSICRRLGALWSYYPVGTVQVAGHPEHTEGYVWGDRTLTTVRCRHCGCVTHWEPLKPDSSAHMAVNIRNFEPSLLEDVKLRRFDGAESWRYVD
jgi:hypothetical protein